MRQGLTRQRRKRRNPRRPPEDDAHRCPRKHADDCPGTLAPPRDGPRRDQEEVPELEEDLPIDVIDIEENLYCGEEAERLPCSARAII